LTGDVAGAIACLVETALAVLQEKVRDPRFDLIGREETPPPARRVVEEAAARRRKVDPVRQKSIAGQGTRTRARRDHDARQRQRTIPAMVDIKVPVHIRQPASRRAINDHGAGKLVREYLGQPAPRDNFERFGRRRIDATTDTAEAPGSHRTRKAGSRRLVREDKIRPSRLRHRSSRSTFCGTASESAPVRSTFCGVLRAASTNCGAHLLLRPSLRSTSSPSVTSSTAL
jgi:hypothetical protein